MRVMILAIALAVFTPTFARAACSDDATALAQKYGITASLPSDSASSSAASTEKLAKSGGVIAPPATGDLAASSPPVPNPEPMATAPSLPAQTASGQQSNKTAKSETGAATDSQAASLLQAARAAGIKGDEATCKQRLADARALLEKTGTTSQ